MIMAESKKKNCYAFVPRSISHKPKRKTVKSVSTPLIKPQHSELSNDAESSSFSNQDDRVKEFSLQQRWPSSDEPECIMCKRYGEYICDETDEDVCSLECKRLHLNSVKNKESVKNVDDPCLYTKNYSSEVEDSENDHDIESIESFYISKTSFNISQDRTYSSKNKCHTIKEKLQIRTQSKCGGSIPNMIFNFDQCLFADKLLKNLQENQYVSPTPVQMQTIPIILSGKDVLVSACTSSGKSASFILPIIHNIYRCLGGLGPTHLYCKYPLAMIITPTRELAIQIEETIKLLSLTLPNLRTALLIGGVPSAPQLHRLKHRIQILIGTPGRINDILINYDLLKLRNIKMLVLDEVDVMLQMGFHNQIETIVELIPSKPQYMMFSATIPPSTERLASEMMKNPIYISVGLSGLPNTSIKQIVLWVEDVSKKKKLFSIIEDSKHFLPPVLIFVDSKVGADLLSESISTKFNISCESIHSDKVQSERTRILQDFLSGVFDILVSTNVMGRGIDLLNVRQVIVFDMPHSIEEYTHQIGRAGGLHSKGFVISFINNSNKKLFYDLKSLFDVDNNKLPDQLIYSPHLKIETEKRQKKNPKISNSAIVRNNNEVNHQNLLQILTKNRKDML